MFKKKYKLNFYAKKVLVRRIFIIKLINFFFRKKNEVKYGKMLKKKREAGLFNIDILHAEMPYPGFEYVIDNNMYGIGRTLRRYSNHHESIDAYIEHGVFFGTHLQLDQLHWGVSKYITLSNTRKDFLGLNTKRKVLSIGPYIHYANSILSNTDFKNIKSDLGKTLLVFPSHSTSTLQTNYSHKAFIEKILDIKSKFQCKSVMVCLYWLDCHNIELVKAYQKAGFRLSCAGHKWDIDFLDRLKSIILLSDLTVSNDVGTHLGYCIHLGKPHFIIDSVRLESKNDAGKEALKMERGIDREREICEVKSAFDYCKNSSYEDISQLQQEIANKYWGTHLVKDKDALSILFKDFSA
jgi:hypothetical protein